MVVGVSQRVTGRGVWNIDTVSAYTGLMLRCPAPIIRVVDTKGAVRSMLIVDEGKYGINQIAEMFDGKFVKIQGTLVERDGVAMVKLLQKVAIATENPSATLSLPSSTSKPTVSLVGEIIDPKYFLGVMKPGEGKTHKACAVLCLRGGISPMFATTDTQGHVIASVIESPELDRLIPFVGDLVEIEGEGTSRVM